MCEECEEPTYLPTFINAKPRSVCLTQPVNAWKHTPIRSNIDREQEEGKKKHVSGMCCKTQKKHERQIKRIKPIRPNILSLRIQSSDLNRRRKKITSLFSLRLSEKEKISWREKTQREGEGAQKFGKMRSMSGPQAGFLLSARCSGGHDMVPPSYVLNLFHV